MKKAVSVILCLSIVSLLCSCTRAGTELADLMIIQGIGIDTEGGGYNVTVEILNNEQTGSASGEGSSDTKTKVYSASGKTVSKALVSIFEKSGNKPLYAHNRVIILGREVLEQGIAEILDFFIRDDNTRPSVLICAAKDKSASEIINAALLPDLIRSDILENILLNGAAASLVPKVQIVDVANFTRDNNSAIMLPTISVEKNGEDEVYSLSGGVLLDSEMKYKAELDKKTVNGAVILAGKIKGGLIETELDDGSEVVLEIVRSHERFKISTVNNKPAVSLDLKVTCDLGEIKKYKTDGTDKELINEIINKAQKSLKKTADDAFTVFKDEYNCDAVMLIKRISNKYGVATVTENTLTDTSLDVSVKIKIRRIGEESYKPKN